MSDQRWTPVLVTPAIAITSSSVASPSVITTTTPHGFASGDMVTIASHAGSTPAVSGAYQIIVVTPTTFTIPLAVTVGGTGGTATRSTAATIISVDDAKAHTRVNLDETDDDEQYARWIAAATLQIERETHIELLPKTYDLTGDCFPRYNKPIDLPFGPLLSVTSVQSYDSANVLQTMTATDYRADTSRIPGRIGLADDKAWPTDLRLFQPVIFRVIVGHASARLVPEPLVMAVRLVVGWHAANREPTCLERGSLEWLLAQYGRLGVA